MSTIDTPPHWIRLCICLLWIGWVCGVFPLQAVAQSDAVRHHIHERFARGTNTSTLMAGGIALTEPERLTQLYEQRHHAPLWSDATGLSPQVTPILDMLRYARNEGLDPEDYHLGTLQTLLATLHSHQHAIPPDATGRLADFDLVLSDAVLSYMLHLSRGRWRPTMQVMPDIPAPASPDPIRVLQEADTTPLLEVLARFIPPHQGYFRLRHALARYCSIAAAQVAGLCFSKVPRCVLATEVLRC